MQSSCGLTPVAKSLPALALTVVRIRTLRLRVVPCPASATGRGYSEILSMLCDMRKLHPQAAISKYGKGELLNDITSAVGTCQKLIKATEKVMMNELPERKMVPALLAQIEQLNGKYKEIKEFCAKLLMDVGNSAGKRKRQASAAASA